MNKLNDYHLRQLLLLKNLINRYEQEEILLPYFITDIKTLIDLLEEDKDWVEAFGIEWTVNMRTIWFELEIIYAINITEDGQYRHLKLSEENLKKINAIIVQLKELVEQQISLIPEPEY